MTQPGYPHVLTGIYYPPGGVRIIIPLIVDTFREAASGVSMYHMSDYTIGASGGTVASTAFAFKNQFTARDVYESSFMTLHPLFERNPDDVNVHNARFDAPLYAGNKRLWSWLSHAQRPKLEQAKYDKKILKASLDDNFGALSMGDANKPHLTITHSLTTNMPILHGHIRSPLFEGKPRNMQYASEGLTRFKAPIYDDVNVVDSLQASMAIPGFIGYHDIESLNQHFIDVGAAAAASLPNIVCDLHEMHVRRVRADEKAAAAAAQKKIWPWPRHHHEEAPVISQLMVMGVGDESGAPYDRSGQRGFVAELQTVLRAINDTAVKPGLAMLHNRFNEDSLAHTGLPALEFIDANIVPRNDIADWPDMEVRNGSLDNMLRLGKFAVREIILPHRETLIAHTNLRMRTLHARNPKVWTQQKLDEVAQNLETRIGTDAAAEKLCSEFLITANSIRERTAPERGRSVAVSNPPTEHAQAPVPVMMG